MKAKRLHLGIIIFLCWAIPFLSTSFAELSLAELDAFDKAFEELANSPEDIQDLVDSLKKGEPDNGASARQGAQQAKKARQEARDRLQQINEKLKTATGKEREELLKQKEKAEALLKDIEHVANYEGLFGTNTREKNRFDTIEPGRGTKSKPWARTKEDAMRKAGDLPKVINNKHPDFSKHLNTAFGRGESPEKTWAREFLKNRGNVPLKEFWRAFGKKFGNHN